MLPARKAEVALAASLEERLLNVWPAIKTLMVNGWAVRFANGYSGRANSASAIVPGARMTHELLDNIELFYNSEGLMPQVRISPVADSRAADAVQKRGYMSKGVALTMTSQIVPQQHKRVAGVDLQLKSAPADSWLEGISTRQEFSKRNSQHLNAIVSRIKVPATYATLQLQGENVGFGICAIDRGWAEIGLIVIDDMQRGKGLGRLLVSGLIDWALRQGASNCFLQVDMNNEPAKRLYTSLGFVPAYPYETWVLNHPA